MTKNAKSSEADNLSSSSIQLELNRIGSLQPNEAVDHLRKTVCLIADHRPQKVRFSPVRSVRKAQLNDFKDSKKAYDNALKVLKRFAAQHDNGTGLLAQHCSLVTSCFSLSDLTKISSNPQSAITMSQSPDGVGGEIFEFQVDRRHLHPVSKVGDSSKKSNKTTVSSCIRQLVAKLKTNAEAMGLPEVYRCFFPIWLPLPSVATPPSIGKGNAKRKTAAQRIEETIYRPYFDTFDEGKSVWTLPSNWKPRNQS